MANTCVKPQQLKVWYIEMKVKKNILSTRGAATHDVDFEKGRGEDGFEVKEMKPQSPWLL
jgi:hypothetical protein